MGRKQEQTCSVLRLNQESGPCSIGIPEINTDLRENGAGIFLAEGIISHIPIVSALGLHSRFPKPWVYDPAFPYAVKLRHEIFSTGHDFFCILQKFVGQFGEGHGGEEHNVSKSDLPCSVCN